MTALKPTLGEGMVPVVEVKDRETSSLLTTPLIALKFTVTVVLAGAYGLETAVATADTFFLTTVSAPV